MVLKLTQNHVRWWWPLKRKMVVQPLESILRFVNLVIVQVIWSYYFILYLKHFYNIYINSWIVKENTNLVMTIHWIQKFKTKAHAKWFWHPAVKFTQCSTYIKICFSSFNLHYHSNSIFNSIWIPYQSLFDCSLKVDRLQLNFAYVWRKLHIMYKKIDRITLFLQMFHWNDLVMIYDGSVYKAILNGHKEAVPLIGILVFVLVRVHIIYSFLHFSFYSIHHFLYIVSFILLHLFKEESGIDRILCIAWFWDVIQIKQHTVWYFCAQRFVLFT